MLKSLSILLLAVAVALPAMAKKPELTCTVKFAFAYTDRLDNDYRGIQGKQLKQVEQKVSKYGDVCYTADDSIADYIFYVHTKPAAYHGVRTTSNTSTNTAPILSVERLRMKTETAQTSAAHWIPPVQRRLPPRFPTNSTTEFSFWTSWCRFAALSGRLTLGFTRSIKKGCTTRSTVSATAKARILSSMLSMRQPSG